MEQRSEEWFAARLGKVTASRVSDVVARTKSGYSASRANYAAELVCERLTGTKAAGFRNAAMDWGVATESEARSSYQTKTGNLVEEVGFINHPDILMAGASPDGFIDDDGLIEIKCPNTATHIENLFSNAHPEKYQNQIQWQLACTGREWCDFVSYDPRMPENMRIFICRVERNEEYINNLEKEVKKFLSEIDETVNNLKALYPERETI